jgi:serine/threonine protein phosphatase 1
MQVIDMTPIYVIGDIHGHLDKLAHAVDLIDRDGGKSAKIIFVGDLVDRGPDSKGVIQFLIDGIASGRNWTVLKGNHDRMFEWFMQTPPRHDAHMLVGMHWFHEKIGGVETLASYGITVTPMIDRLYEIHAQAISNVPPAHVDFLKSQKLLHRDNNFIFAHAGINPSHPMDAQSEEDLLWLRAPDGYYPKDLSFLVIHGHTPIAEPTHFGTHINVDGGAAFGRAIIPIVLCTDGVFSITSHGRTPIKRHVFG